MTRWTHIQAVQIGTAHSQLGLFCQDKAVSEEVKTEEDSVFVAVVSDGAGSASHSHIGSNIATQLTLKYIKEFLECNSSIESLAESEVTIQGWVRQIQEQIIEVANDAGVSRHKYACTLTVAIVHASLGLFFQVGDGGIIFGKDDSYDLAFWPMQYEYANVTDFVTGTNATQALRIKAVQCPIDRVAVMSDGLHQLALVFESQKVHIPFFKAMFQPLQRHLEIDPSKSLSSEKLSEALCQFLASPIVCEKTDDDKSLVLALLDYSIPLHEN